MAGESIGLLAQGGSSQNIQLRQQQQQNYVEQFKQVGYQVSGLYKSAICPAFEFLIVMNIYSRISCFI